MSKHDMRYFMPERRTEFGIGRTFDEHPRNAHVIIASQVSDRRAEVRHGDLACHHVRSETAHLNNSRYRPQDAWVSDLGPHALVVRSGLLAGVRRCGVGADTRDGAHRENCRSGRAKHTSHSLPVLGFPPGWRGGRPPAYQHVPPQDSYQPKYFPVCFWAGGTLALPHAGFCLPRMILLGARPGISAWFCWCRVSESDIPDNTMILRSFLCAISSNTNRIANNLPN